MQSVSCKRKDSDFFHVLIISPAPYSNGCRQLKENLVFVEIPRFLFFLISTSKGLHSNLRRCRSKDAQFPLVFKPLMSPP